MRVINRKNVQLYNYSPHTIADGVFYSIIMYIVAVLLLIISILISYIFLGEAPLVVAGIGISSIAFNLVSMIFIILEVYLYKNFHSEIRNMLLLQLLLFSIWIFII